MILKIKVPATSANLGPGFDVAGLALNLYNTFTFDFTKNDISFTDPNHIFPTSLTLDTFFKVLDMYNIDYPKGTHLHTDTHIPIARGLGSSSTCIVAGVLAANKYANLDLSKHKLARIASKIEGHPDNVVPAIFGNISVALLEDELYVQSEHVSQDYGFIAIIPNHQVATKDARDILPKTIKLSDLTYTQSRTLFLLNAFKNYNPSLIKTVIADRIHEPYRKQLIENISLIEYTLSTQNAITHWISGAGPTIMVLTHIEDTDAIAFSLSKELASIAMITVLQVDTKGAIIE